MSGEVAEWPNAYAWKAYKAERSSGVRIPPSPHMQNFCTLYIVRHGETEWNVKKIIQGHADIPLNKKGETQAKELAKKLRHIKFDAIFSSDLIRAKKTAEIISLEKKLTIQTTKELRERYFGKYQGQSFAVNNEMVKLINNLKMFSGPGLKEIESDENIILRITTFLREIAVSYCNKTVLIVIPWRTNENFIDSSWFCQL